MTKVVNIHKEKFDVYIGRAGKGNSGYYGNPIKIDKDNKCFLCGNIHSSAGSTLDCYKVYFMHRIDTDEIFKKRILGLKDKTLGCFCGDNCHGNVIKEYLDNQ